MGLKLRRRLLLEDISARSGRVTIAGRVLSPARPARPVVVEQRTSCNRYARATRVTPSAGGRFRLTVVAPPDASAAVYRLHTLVPRGRRLHRTART